MSRKLTGKKRAANLREFADKASNKLIAAAYVLVLHETPDADHDVIETKVDSWLIYTRMAHPELSNLVWPAVFQKRAVHDLDFVTRIKALKS